MAQTNCLITAGYTIGCLDNTGGAQEIYIANWTSDASYDLDVDDTITGVTSGNTYYKFETPKQTAGLVETPNVSVENGTVFYNQDVTLVLNKMEADLRNQILLITRATTTIILKDQNGNYWLVGKQNGANVSGGAHGTGTAYGDRNGYSLTLTSMEPELAHPIDYAAFSAMIG